MPNDKCLIFSFSRGWLREHFNFWVSESQAVIIDPKLTTINEPSLENVATSGFKSLYVTSPEHIQE